MIKKMIFVFCLIICFGDSHSQTNILGRIHHVKGIYRNYSEFLNNDPFYKENFDGIKKMLIKESFRKGDSTMVYRLYIKIEDNLKIDSIWGLCDGTDVYIFQQRDIQNHYFFLVNKWDRYSIIHTFEYITAVDAASSWFINGIPGFISYFVQHEIRIKIPYFLNINNGEKFLLSKKTLLKLISSDPVLKASYLSEKNKNNANTLIKYVEAYNQFNRGEIKVKLVN